jgi:transposase
MEALRVDIEQSNEPRKGARRDGGAVVRVERRRHWSDEEKLAILKETTQPGVIVQRLPVGMGSGRVSLHLAQAIAARRYGGLRAG